MKSKILKYQIFSFIFISILGILLHFFYKWSGNNSVVGIISSVNESTWEHLKLIFYPMLISTIIGYFYIGKEKNNLLCSKTIGIISASIFTILFFYAYTGVIGVNNDIINISIFFIAVALGEYISYRLMMLNQPVCSNNTAILILIILLGCFILFTFYTPRIGLFKDPINGSYGI